MIVRIILLSCLLMVACSSPSEERAGGKHPVNESELPIAKSLNTQAEQLRKTSNELQIMLEQWEENR